MPQSWYLYKENEKLHELEKREKLMHITKLYFNLFPGKIIAVTGSTGKTTTTNLIAEIFQCAKEDKKIHENFFFTGNDRRMDQMLTSIENAKEAAKICSINILGHLKNHLGSLDRIKKVVRINGFVQSDNGFHGQPDVLNAASDFFAEVFGEMGKHTRTAYGVLELPANATVELDAIVEVE